MRWLRFLTTSLLCHGALVVAVLVWSPTDRPAPVALAFEIVRIEPATPPAPLATAEPSEPVRPPAEDKPAFSETPRRGGATRGSPDATQAPSKIAAPEPEPTAASPVAPAPANTSDEPEDSAALHAEPALLGLPVLSAEDTAALEATAARGASGLIGHGAGGQGGRGDGSGTGRGAMRWPLPINPPGHESLPYPRAALKWRVHGQVELRLLVDATGKVTKVEVVKGLGWGMDEIAEERAHLIHFQPGLDYDGRPIAMYVTWKLNFEMP